MNNVFNCEPCFAEKREYVGNLTAVGNHIAHFKVGWIINYDVVFLEEVFSADDGVSVFADELTEG